MPVPWFLPLAAAPFAGSFIGVLIERLPAGRPVAWDRSRCDSCGRTLTPVELVPLVAFAMQGGRCRGCRARIGWFHPAVELAALGVAACAVAGGAEGARLWLGCLLGWTLLALAWIDWRHLLLPDALTLPLLLAGLGVAAARGGDATLDSVLGATLGFLVLAGLAALYRRLRGGEGLGGGDAKLLAAGGAWLGATALPWVVLAAALLGIALALAMARGRPSATLAVPFGPPLALAIFLAWMLPGV